MLFLFASGGGEVHSRDCVLGILLWCIVRCSDVQNYRSLLELFDEIHIVGHMRSIVDVIAPFHTILFNFSKLLRSNTEKRFSDRAAKYLYNHGLG